MRFCKGMNILFLSQCLLLAAIVLCPDNVAGQFTAALPTCPGDTFKFMCAVVGDMNGLTTWRVGGSSECPLPHRSNSSSICGPGKAFTARSGTGFGTTATFYSSILSGTSDPALDGTLVECFGTPNSTDPGNRINGSTLQILGPSSVPTLSCVELTKNISGAVIVTVHWTLSGGDSADFYLINITSNAPQTPNGGPLNITSSSVTIAGFMADYEYNITVRGVNCECLEGNESEPLTITPQDTANNLLTGEIASVNSFENAKFNCTFLSGFTGSSRCQLQYGTNATFMELPYSVESTENGTAGDTVSVVLKERLNSSTVYYYNVSAVNRCLTVTVQGIFITPQYNCSPEELWNLTATNATFLPDVNLLNDATKYPKCDPGGVESAVLRDTRFNINITTVAYYTGITPGSRACFVCDKNSGHELNTTINERVCEHDATWSRSPIICVSTCTLQHLTRWHVVVIAVGVLSLVIAIFTTFMIFCFKKDKTSFILLLVVIAFCVPGLVVWITVGVVVTNPPNGNLCDSGWAHSRDRLIISGLVSSIFPIILVPILLFIYMAVVHKCCKTRDEKSKPNCPTSHNGSDEDGTIEMQLKKDAVAEPEYDSLQHDPPGSPTAEFDPSDLSYSYLTEVQVSTGISYGELGPHIPPAAITPPAIDNNVWYTSLLHQSEQSALNPAGSVPTTSNDATPNSQIPLGTPPPIPPQQFLDEDILLFPQLPENMEIQQDGRDAPPPLPPKPSLQNTTVPPLTSKANQEDTTVPCLSQGKLRECSPITIPT